MKKIKKRYDKSGRLTEEIVYDENGEIVESTSYKYEEPPTYLSFPNLKDIPKEEPEEFNLNEQEDINNTESANEDSDEISFWPVLVIISILLFIAFFFIVISYSY